MKKCPQCGVEYTDATTLCPADGVALEKTDDSLIGTTLAGKYRIEDFMREPPSSSTEFSLMDLISNSRKHSYVRIQRVRIY